MSKAGIDAKAGLETPVQRGSGWGAVIASGAGFGLGLSGLPFYTMGVFVAPLHRAFGWSAVQVQGGLTLLLLTNMASLPAAAWLTERIGARWVGLGSVILFSLVFMSLGALTGDLMGFYARWLLMSAAGAGTLAVVWTRGISGWFSHRRGTALGAAMMGTGVTGLLAPPLTNALIAHLGWRAAYVSLGAIPLLIAGPLVWLLFHEAAPALAPSASVSGRTEVRFRVERRWRFWLIGAAFLMIGWAVAGVIPNLIKLLGDVGYTPARAAGLASLVGLAVIVGRFGCGVLLDRFWAPAVASGFFVLAAAACLLLRAAPQQAWVAVFTSAAIGFAAGAEFDVLPYLTGRYFGVKRVGSVLGWISVFFYFGAALGPWGFGRLHELTRAYDIPLLIAAAALGVGGLSLLALGPYGAVADD